MDFIDPGVPSGGKLNIVGQEIAQSPYVVLLYVNVLKNYILDFFKCIDATLIIWLAMPSVIIIAITHDHGAMVGWFLVSFSFFNVLL